jgi:hypothetical protein
MNNNGAAGSPSTEFEVKISLADADAIEPLYAPSLARPRPIDRLCIKLHQFSSSIRKTDAKNSDGNKFTPAAHSATPKQVERQRFPV